MTHPPSGWGWTNRDSLMDSGDGPGITTAITSYLSSNTRSLAPWQRYLWCYYLLPSEVINYEQRIQQREICMFLFVWFRLLLTIIYHDVIIHPFRNNCKRHVPGRNETWEVWESNQLTGSICQRLLDVPSCWAKIYLFSYRDIFIIQRAISLSLLI